MTTENIFLAENLGHFLIQSTIIIIIIINARTGSCLEELYI
jgi:hypothetical protein